MLFPAYFTASIPFLPSFGIVPIKSCRTETPWLLWLQPALVGVVCRTMKVAIVFGIPCASEYSFSHS